MADYKISANGKPDLIVSQERAYGAIRLAAHDDNRADLWILTLETKGVLVLTMKGTDITFKRLGESS